MYQCLWLILQNLGFQVSNAKTPIYKYSQPTIDIIKSNHLTSQIKHISVPIHSVYEQYTILTMYPAKLKPTIHLVDIGTKSSTDPLLEHHYS